MHQAIVMVSCSLLLTLNSGSTYYQALHFVQKVLTSDEEDLEIGPAGIPFQEATMSQALESAKCSAGSLHDKCCILEFYLLKDDGFSTMFFGLLLVSRKHPLNSITIKLFFGLFHVRVTGSLSQWSCFRLSSTPS